MNRPALVSVALLVAVGAFLATSVRFRRARAARPVPGLAVNDSEPRPGVTPSRVPTREVSNSKRAGQFSYRQLQSADLATYIRNLQSVHCPDAVIADIILAEVNRRFAQREAAARLHRHQRDAWVADTHPKTDWDRRSELFELWQEKAALVKELLGIDLPPDVTPVNPSRTANDRMEASLAKLPAAKRPLVRETVDRLYLAERQFTERVNGILLAEDWQEWQRMHAESHARLGQILTPDELAEVELRGTGVETRLRADLAAFDPQAAELEKLLRIEGDFHVGGAVPGQIVDPNGQRDQAAYLTRKQEQIAAVLGPERFAEYQRAQDPGYRDLSALLRQHGVAADQVAGSYEIITQVQRDLSLAIADTASQSAPTPAAINAATQQATLRLQQLLGDAVWQKVGGQLPGLPTVPTTVHPPKP